MTPVNESVWKIDRIGRLRYTSDQKKTTVDTYRASGLSEAQLAAIAKEMEEAAAVCTRGELELPPVDENGVPLTPAQELALARTQAARRVDEIRSQLYRRLMGLALGKKPGRADLRQRSQNAAAMTKNTAEMLESADGFSSGREWVARRTRYQLRGFSGSLALPRDASATQEQRFGSLSLAFENFYGIRNAGINPALAFAILRIAKDHAENG